MNHSQLPLVKARQLIKRFGQQNAVDGINFDILAGEIFGFLGPNGAGKTTTIRMLLNLITPSSGELRLFDKEFHSHKSEILSMMNTASGTLTLPGKLSAEENLRVFADMYGISQPSKRVAELLVKFDLEEMKKKPLYSLSSGQQVRVSLAKAFLNKPRLLLLDEPTSSLDPEVADRIRTFLLNIVQEEGTTVFLTSHNMVEVEKVCSRVVFINQGKIQAEGSPKELAKRIRKSKVKIILKNSQITSPLTFPQNDIQVELKGNMMNATCDQTQVGFLITSIVQKGFEIESLKIEEPTLEDFFVHSARAQS